MKFKKSKFNNFR